MVVRWMVKHSHLLVCFLLGVVLTATAGSVGAQGPAPQTAPQAALGTAFTYQGWLEDGVSPANGSFDLQFRLYDAAEGGAQIGSTVTREDVAIADGLFTVSLDFGAAPFAGQARYLEAAVRPGESAGSYTALSPRQPLTATPYALYAQNVPAHTHLGQTWSGSNNPLKIEGSFIDPDYAPLVLSNSGTDGDGLRIKSASDDGVQVVSAGDDGLTVSSAGGDGVYVVFADGDGVYVYDAGTPSTHNASSDKNGFEVAGAEVYGLYVGRADVDGVQVASAGDDGVQVTSAGDDGFEVVDAQGCGLYVGQADVDGVYIESVGSDGVQVKSAGDDGVYVNSAGDDGVYVESAGNSGVEVLKAGTPSVHYENPHENGFEVDGAQGYGLYVGRADRDGVYVYSAGGYAGNFVGTVRVTGNLTKGGGSFQIDHPLDPENKYLSHSFVESPDMMNIYNGNVTTDQDGYATVTLPDYFEALNRDYRYQLTVIGTFAQAIIAQEIEANQFVIQTDRPAVKVSWQVTGIRQDPYANANRIVVEQDKPLEERGTYLHPLAYGLPEERGLAFKERQAHLTQEKAP